MCRSQRSQAFELATTTERLQVGGGYTVVNKLPAEMLLVFPFNVIDKSTMAFLTDQSWRVLKSWYTARISALFRRRT